MMGGFGLFCGFYSLWLTQIGGLLVTGVRGFMYVFAQFPLVSHMFLGTGATCLRYGSFETDASGTSVVGHARFWAGAGSGLLRFTRVGVRGHGGHTSRTSTVSHFCEVCVEVLDGLRWPSTSHGTGAVNGPGKVNGVVRVLPRFYRGVTQDPVSAHSKPCFVTGTLLHLGRLV